MDDQDKKLLMKAFGAHFKRIRNEKGISLRLLDQLSDVDYSQIHRIEKGLSAPSIITLVALAKALKVPLTVLTDFEY